MESFVDMGEEYSGDFDVSEADDLPDESAGIQGYLFEPKYTAAELVERRAAREVAAQLPQPEPIPRAGVDWWCRCDNCPIQDTDIESLCCTEWCQGQHLLTELAVGSGASHCLTNHGSFAAHLDPGVLRTFFSCDRINWRQRSTPAGPNGTLSNL